MPALAHLTYFSFYPVARSIYLSFTSWNLSGTPEFIGLNNYFRLANDPDFIRSVQVTLGYSFFLSLALFLTALIMALLFDRKFPLRDLFRTIYFIPVVIPWVVTALVWNLIYNPSYGLSNIFTDALHLGPVLWIQNVYLVGFALIIMSVWKGFGYYMVIFLAGLQNIPAEYYEAAQVDGASRWNTLWHITLPLLRPAMLLVAVSAVTDSFQVFTPVWLMTQGGPAGASRVLTIYVYQTAFSFQKMGYATAIASLMLITLVVVTRLQIRFWQTEY
ncbi:MAG: sugar ABC transporter permease [Anaerolineae bacterium]|nr:sugar ABC transporter permease [Anaerolineae bacterium]